MSTPTITYEVERMDFGLKARGHSFRSAPKHTPAKQFTSIDAACRSAVALVRARPGVPVKITQIDATRTNRNHRTVHTRIATARSDALGRVWIDAEWIGSPLL